MRRVYQRAAARRDLVDHYVYLAEQADEDTAERFIAQAEQTLSIWPRTGRWALV